MEFLDSCVSHSYPQHGREPTANQWYSEPKLRRTAELNRQAVLIIEAAEWAVVRIWGREQLEAEAERVVELVRTRRRGS